MRTLDSYRYMIINKSLFLIEIESFLLLSTNEGKGSLFAHSEIIANALIEANVLFLLSPSFFAGLSWEITPFPREFL